MRRTLFAVVIAFLPLFAAAQSSPFLPEELHNKLTSEISGDIAYDHLRTLTQFHAINGATRDFKREAQWIAEKAREIGLSDVRIHELPYEGLAWTPLSAEAWLIEPSDGGQQTSTKLASFAEVAVSIANYSRSAGVEAELVDVGAGTSERDYQGKDVKGKIVLTSGNPVAVESEAVWKRGALGVLSFWTSRVNPFDYPDQISWGSVHPRPQNGKEPSWAFMIPYRMGLDLQRRLRGEAGADLFAPPDPKAAKPQPLRVRVKIEAEILPTATQGLVEGWIRGSKIKDQQVVLTSHVQEEKTSANDDRSGVASMLEIARALVTMINDGLLPRPERDIRFWWANEISAEYQWFALHPDDRKNIFVNINQDMVGANQTIGGLSRVQHVTRTPWSRPTFFNDVVESVVMALYHGNNSYLAARQAGSQAPGSNYPKPIFSRLGSRDRWSAEIVPYFDSTDHLVFNDAWIATTHGGITFTNWPDEYIHSSGDDLWQIDPTQLKRNSVAVSALAWYMANVGAGDVDGLASVMLSAGRARLNRNMAAVAAAKLEGRTFTGDEPIVQSEARAREQRAMLSLQSIAPLDVELRKKTGKLAEAVGLGPLGEGMFSGGWSVPAAQQRIPVRIDSVADYLKNQEKMKPVPGLHPLMGPEAFAFADGKRSVWEIYAALRAESLAEGEWYYGKVTPEMVQQFFDNAAAAGLVTLKDAPAK